MSKSTAHLVVWLRTDCGIPSMIDCRIHSSGPAGLTMTPGVIYAEIMNVSAATYQEAHDKMMHLCKTLPGLAWTRAFLDDSNIDAHIERTTLMSILRRGMPGAISRSEWPRPLSDISEEEKQLCLSNQKQLAIENFMNRNKCDRQTAKSVINAFMKAKQAG